MKSTKILILFVCSISFFIASLFAFDSNVTVYATDPKGYSIQMTEGASVRVNAPYGIRFKAMIGEELAQDEDASFGMTIIPYDWVSEYSLSEDYISELDATGLTYLKFACLPIKDGDDYYIQASITSILENNLEREFIGIAWYEIAGVKTYAYSEKCARSVKYVATKALINETSEQYSPAERDFLLRSANAYSFDGTSDLVISDFSATRGEEISIYYKKSTEGNLRFSVKNSLDEDDFYGLYDLISDVSSYNGVKIEQEGSWNKLTVRINRLDVESGDPDSVSAFDTLSFDAESAARFDVIGVSVTESERLTVLFQGDSITDNGRDRNNLDDLGGGYAAMAAKALNAAYGNSIDFTFINRGNSGWNLIDDWNKGGVNYYEREFYQYNADIATILIGYNDIIDHANDGGVSDEQFRSCYRELLQGLKDRGTVAVCLACFDINPHIPYRVTEFEAKRTIVRDLAEEFGFPFIDMKPYMLQAVEDGAYKMELFGDLTHPWAAGCRIISELVVDKISALIDEDYVTPDDLGKWEPLSVIADNAEDLTNGRSFLATTHGIIEYDTEVFCSDEDFVSTQSLKATHENPDPVQTGGFNNIKEQANSFTRVLFDISDQGGIDMTSGKLIFNVKMDNFIPYVSVQAYGSIVRYNTKASNSYTVYLENAISLGDGWYKIEINLAQWAAIDTTNVLKSVGAIIITASKGESNNERAQYGVNGSENSYMWLDNLRIEEPDNSYGTDPWANDIYG